MGNESAIEVRQDFSTMLAVKEGQASYAVTVDTHRAVREVEAALTVAKARPRDELDAYKDIITSCKRPSFAEKAIYRYRRGKEMVEGPSIRMAENMARAYGNLEYGWREVERNLNKSMLEAYCWDLQTNTKRKMTFEVVHQRDTKEGARPLLTERDIYEHLANYAARRVRSCILSIIPADLIDDAMKQCRTTSESGINSINKTEIAKKIVLTFEEIGVTHDQLKKFLGVEKVVGASEKQLVELRQIYASIKDGQATAKEFFSIVEDTKLHGSKSENLAEKLETSAKAE